MSTASIPLPNLDSLLAPIHLFSSYNHFISTNNKFFKFYLFTLWFLLHFKHSINTHDFNLIIQSLVNSFHNQSHNAFDSISFKLGNRYLHTNDNCCYLYFSEAPPSYLNTLLKNNFRKNKTN